MGIQDKGEVTLIRHAYVTTKAQKQGIGKNNNLSQKWMGRLRLTKQIQNKINCFK